MVKQLSPDMLFIEIFSSKDIEFTALAWLRHYTSYVCRQPHATRLNGPEHELGQGTVEAAGTAQVATSTLPCTLLSWHTQLHRS